MPSGADGGKLSLVDGDADPPRWHSQGLADVPPDDSWLTVLEAGWLAGMRFPKRRSEFRLGRWTAKNALARWLGMADDLDGLRRIEIGRSPEGAPVPAIDGRPAPAAISLSDRADWAVCVIVSAGREVGCDLELVEPRSDAFVADYLTPRERALVTRAAASEGRDIVANLIWSAKESALKLLRTGLRRDTRSVEVSFSGTAGLDGWQPLTAAAAEGRTFPGWWRRYGVFLLTTATAASTPPPRALVEPPPLAAAVPSHAWWKAQ